MTDIYDELDPVVDDGPDADIVDFAAPIDTADKPGYIVVINTNPSGWRGARVQTDDRFLQNQTLKAYAWSSTVSGQDYQPDDQACDASGGTQVFAPPRGYAVFSVNGLTAPTGMVIQNQGTATIYVGGTAPAATGGVSVPLTAGQAMWISGSAQTLSAVTSAGNASVIAGLASVAAVI